jgi:hypothetical protein
MKMIKIAIIGLHLKKEQIWKNKKNRHINWVLNNLENIIKIKVNFHMRTVKA